MFPEYFFLVPQNCTQSIKTGVVGASYRWREPAILVLTDGRFKRFAGLLHPVFYKYFFATLVI
jgi:hypothetical protein